VEQFEAHLVRRRRCPLGKNNREYPSHSWPHEPSCLYRHGGEDNCLVDFGRSSVAGEILSGGEALLDLLRRRGEGQDVRSVRWRAVRPLCDQQLVMTGHLLAPGGRVQPVYCLRVRPDPSRYFPGRRFELGDDGVMFGWWHIAGACLFQCLRKGLILARAKRTVAMLQMSCYGRLVGDPRPIETRSGKPMTVARLAVAVPSRDEDGTFFLGLVAFGSQAERLAALAKGTMLSAIGRAQLSRWTSDQGEREELQLVVDELITAKSVRPGQPRKPAKPAPRHTEAAPFNDDLRF
jgi:single-strand DNA-binding protein